MLEGAIALARLCALKCKLPRQQDVNAPTGALLTFEMDRWNSPLHLTVLVFTELARAWPSSGSISPSFNLRVMTRNLAKRRRFTLRPSCSDRTRSEIVAGSPDRPFITISRGQCCSSRRNAALVPGYVT